MKCWILALLLCTARLIASDAQPTYISYEEFVRAVEADKVTEVNAGATFDIHGVLRGDRGSVSFITAHEMVASNDPLLKQLLRSHGLELHGGVVVSTVSYAEGHAGWLWIEFGAVTTLMLVVIAVFQLRILRRLEKRANQPREPTASGRGSS